MILETAMYCCVWSKYDCVTFTIVWWCRLEFKLLVSMSYVIGSGDFMWEVFTCGLVMVLVVSNGVVWCLMCKSTCF